jgi:ABC-2 type transport system permease protein
MPDIIYGVSTVIPLTYFLNVLRGIMLKGNTFMALYQEFIILSSFGAVFLVLAIIKFKKKID